jgi:DNA replication and repair protein RecF
VDVQELRLREFRNYGEETVGFVPGLNLVLGHNGQGKTNLIEAIYVLCGLGSHRGASGDAMVRHGASEAILSADGRAGDRQLRLDAQIRRSGGTRLLVNRVVADRATGAPPLVAVAFSPDDLVVIKGAPEERRRLLDQGAARLRTLAGTERQEFERVLRQRTGLLKAAPGSRRALATLDVWDESFARAGAAVVRNRLQVLVRLLPEVRRRYRELAGMEAEVVLVYRPTWSEGVSEEAMLGEGGPQVVQEALFAALAAARGRDLERGVSTVGPHRDDLEVVLGGADARVYASQGEQRSLALSLRMAERDLVAESRGEDPILLLDDIFSELDERRRERLVHMVAEAGQTIATATSGAGWPLAVQRTLVVEEGRVSLGG